MSDVDRFRDALASPAFSHVSVRNWCGMQAYAYHADASSPTGVLVAAGLPLADAEPILREMGVPAHIGPQRGDLAFADAQGAEAK